jgi:3-deoxy-D-manno-octulosonic-acid transferase
MTLHREPRIGRPWARRLYSALLWLLSPLIWWRVWREQALAHPRRQRLGFLAPTPASERVLWLHCASVGEVQAARPLIEALLERYPGHSLTVTTMTATGAQRVQALVDERLERGSTPRLRHAFVPLDFAGAARRFVSRLDPQLAIFFETELWPNLLHACSRRGVPVAVVNARLSDRAFRGYRRLRPLMREALDHVDWLAAKSPADARRFQALGMALERSEVVGSLKFDSDLDPHSRQVSERLRTLFGKRPVWVAGSTHGGEDEQVLAAHIRLRLRHPSALLVLVPRHPRRFAVAAALCAERGLATACRSRGDLPHAGTAVYLGDTMGELLSLYGAGDLAFVGGSLVAVGGHNLLEPAALGVPVLTGPHLANFADVAEVLRDAQALVEVSDERSLAAMLETLFDDIDERRRLAEAGRQVVIANRGALERILAGLERLLSAK